MEAPKYKPKVCQRCHNMFTPRSGIAKYCVVCRPVANKEWFKEHYRNNRAEILAKQHKPVDNSKSCALCGNVFIPKGPAKYCVECRPLAGRLRQKKYRDKNKETLAAKDREYRRRPVPRFNEMLRKQKYNREHKEQIDAQKLKWRSNNPHKVKAWSHKRRALKRGNGGSFTFKELNDLFGQQEGFCYYCGELLYASFDRDVHIDHKIPLSRGGTSNIENIVLTCSYCNLCKGSKTEEEFRNAKLVSRG